MAARGDRSSDGPTVLVVDDTQTVRRAISLMLGAGGFLCLEAGDGLEALSMMQTETVDALMTDLYMPNLDGLGLLRRLRAEPESRAMPVLVLTTESDPMVIEQLLDAGATQVIIKPVDQDRLCEIVRQSLPQTG